MDRVVQKLLLRQPKMYLILLFQVLVAHSPTNLANVCQAQSLFFLYYLPNKWATLINLLLADFK